MLCVNIQETLTVFGGLWITVLGTIKRALQPINKVIGCGLLQAQGALLHERVPAEQEVKGLGLESSSEQRLDRAAQTREVGGATGHHKSMRSVRRLSKSRSAVPQDRLHRSAEEITS